VLSAVANARRLVTPAADVATALEGLLAHGGGRDEATRVRYGAEHSMENYVAGLLAALGIADGERGEADHRLFGCRVA